MCSTGARDEIRDRICELQRDRLCSVCIQSQVQSVGRGGESSAAGTCRWRAEVETCCALARTTMLMLAAFQLLSPGQAESSLLCVCLVIFKQTRVASSACSWPLPAASLEVCATQNVCSSQLHTHCMRSLLRMTFGYKRASSYCCDSFVLSSNKTSDTSGLPGSNKT